MKRTVALAFASVLAAALSARSWPALAASYWQRNPRDPHWVQGRVDLATPASAVWQRIANVPAWPTLFSDIASFSIRSRSSDGARWTVHFESRTFGHGEHDYVVVLDSSNMSSRIAIDALGVRAVAYANLGDIAGAGTRADYALFVDTYGFFGWFVPERDLRMRQERLVERTLRDLEKTFGLLPDARDDSLGVQPRR